MGRIQIDYVLPSGRAMPIEEPVAGRRAEDKPLGRKKLRSDPVRPHLGQFDLQAAEMGFAIFVCVKAMNTHQLGSHIDIPW